MTTHTQAALDEAAVLFSTCTNPSNDLLGTIADKLAAVRAESAGLVEALDLTASDAHMLERAITEGDPKSELLHRIGDIKKTCREALAKATQP